MLVPGYEYKFDDILIRKYWYPLKLSKLLKYYFIKSIIIITIILIKYEIIYYCYFIKSTVIMW